jgi:Asp-tRNA(Asn)/Glu-tRNA(Gln) amidotransferase A subunit family amidase
MTEKTTSMLTAQEWAEGCRSGALGLEDTLSAHVAYATEVDKSVSAFVALGGDPVQDQIERLQSQRHAGLPAGPLFGVPIGIKDIIDTVDFATECGSPIHSGRYAIADATLVRRLREAGALIMGKTATTEFATFHPAATRNPHALERTPGGSSSGSAAAVAAGLVPVAIGSQTNGSVIRPASFCGVYGFKPSFGLIPRTGMFEQSSSLDQVGLFARNLEDLARVAQVIAGDDGVDEASFGIAPHRFYDIALEPPPVAPKFCFVRTPWWDRVEPTAQEAYLAFLDLMGADVEVLQLPAVVEQAVEWQALVNEPELALALMSEWLHHRDGLSPAMRARLEKAYAISASDYLRAKRRMPHVRHAFDEFFDRYDAILCPAALGVAPSGLESTGNPIMQTVWTLGGLPSVNLPLLQGDADLPLGVQAIGAFRQDGRLLRSLRWFVSEFNKRVNA